METLHKTRISIAVFSKLIRTLDYLSRDADSSTGHYVILSLLSIISTTMIIY